MLKHLLMILFSSEQIKSDYSPGLDLAILHYWSTAYFPDVDVYTSGIESVFIPVVSKEFQLRTLNSILGTPNEFGTTISGLECHASFLDIFENITLLLNVHLLGDYYLTQSYRNNFPIINMPNQYQINAGMISNISWIYPESNFFQFN